MLDQLIPAVNYTIRLNAAASRYELWNGRLKAHTPTDTHAAYWLAQRTAEKYPHLAALAWRGAEVVARGRVYLRDANAFTRATIANPTGEPYQVAWEYVPDYTNWEYVNGQPVNPQIRITTCTCEAYRRGLAQHNGHPYCKHIWAELAQRTLDGLSYAFADAIDAMRRLNRHSQPPACRVCGREFTPGELLDGDQCYDLDACMERKRAQRNTGYAVRSREWAHQGQRRFNQYCQSGLGAQAYVLKAMANAAPSLPADKVQRAYRPVDCD